jgi:hypothetical protein
MSGLGQRRGHRLATTIGTDFYHKDYYRIVIAIASITVFVAVYYRSTAGFDYSINLDNIKGLYESHNNNNNNNNSNNNNNNSSSNNNPTANNITTTTTSTTTATSGSDKPITIAYAISLIQCGNFESTSAGLVDASIVLRHSVHLTSVRNPESGSRYDYKMYAIVHTDAAKCSSLLEDAGFTVLVRDVPVRRDEIQNDYLRKNIHKEWCCGHDEFIKLYAYTILDEPIVVHVDIDYIFHKPMDALYDAILYDANHEMGISARGTIPVERPFTTLDQWPTKIDAFMTRDWPQVIPGRKAAYQAGLLVVRPSMEVFNIILDVIRTANYTEGFGRDNGWGGKGT